MIVIATLIIFFGLFWFVRKHTGPAHLAVIAGLSVYSLLGPQILDLVGHTFADAPIDIIRECLYLALIVFFPLVLYFRSERGGLRGLLRLVDAAIFATLITTLISGVLARFFTFDVWANQIADAISGVEGIIIAVGIVAAYLDILLYRKHDD
jgi:hypothetical protein